MDGEMLRAIIAQGESATVECKVAPPRPIDSAERICGFANGQGGYIIIGVADTTWDIVGVKNSAQAIDSLLHAARVCKPPVRFAPEQPEVVNIGGNDVVVAYVPPDREQVHQASGVFWIRRGTITVPLELREIKTLLYTRATLSWETLPVARATLDDLNLTLVEQYIAQRPDRSRLSGRLANVTDLLINLECAIEAADGVVRPTRAGMLLFGQTPQVYIPNAEIVAILYREGDTLGTRRYSDRRILHGTIPQQIEQAQSFVEQYVAVSARTVGFRRVDVPDYPLEALREAVVNAVVHRDYSLAGEAVRLFFYTGNRIEIHNPGILLPGLSLDALREGRVRSRPRNPVLANILRDLPGGYMERVGSGISFMINTMQQAGLDAPTFDEPGEFVVTFHTTPQANLTSETAPSEAPTAVHEPSERTQAQRQERILQFLQQNGEVTNRQYRELFGVSEATALRDLDDMVTRGILRVKGEKRGRRYLR